MAKVAVIRLDVTVPIEDEVKLPGGARRCTSRVSVPGMKSLYRSMMIEGGKTPEQMEKIVSSFELLCVMDAAGVKLVPMQSEEALKRPEDCVIRELLVEEQCCKTCGRPATVMVEDEPYCTMCATAMTR